MAGHGSPNSPELISMLQDWLPSHLGSSIVKVVKVVKVVKMVKVVGMRMMTRRRMMIMTRKWGK